MSFKEKKNEILHILINSIKTVRSNFNVCLRFNPRPCDTKINFQLNLIEKKANF